MVDQFSISQLQQLSGIKAHTIRIWEQRYNALIPNRSEGNTRSYDNDQLKRLLNIVSLLEEGYKISNIGGMSDEEIHQLIAQKLKTKIKDNDKNESLVSQLIMSAMSYDEPQFETIYNQCVSLYGLKKTYIDFLYPFLKRMGLLWGIDSISPAQEHFSSNLIRKKIFSSINALPEPQNKSKKWLLFLPENEFHEIPLLFANYLLRLDDQRVIYLGASVPTESLANTKDEIKPTDILFFFIQHINPEDANNYMETLRKTFPRTNIHVSGNEHLLEEVLLPKQINWIKSPTELMTSIGQ